MDWSSPLRDLADLVLGRRCLGCDVPGPDLCPACLATLRTRPLQLTRPDGLTVIAATTYETLARRVVIAYKERGHLSLAVPLGILLADAVHTVLREHDAAACTLVPIPGHRRSQRGFDALAAITRYAVRDLRRRGTNARTAPLLRADADYAPLKRLGRQDRQERIAGAFRSAPAHAGTRASGPDHPIVIVDDIVTSGATTAEAVRTLTRAGLRITGIAAVAATPVGRRDARRQPG